MDHIAPPSAARRKQEVPYTIQIVTASEPRLGTGLIAALARLWQADGNRVEIGRFGLVTADIALMHVDRTQVAPRHVPKNPASRPLLNGAVLDISKRRVSANLVTPRSPWQGPVIVKTDANHMGKPELTAKAKWAAEHKRVGGALKLLGRAVAPKPAPQYTIYPAIAAVPPPVWRRSDLVVEKFLPQRHGDLFVLHSWVFFGDQGFVRTMFSKDPIIKPRNTLRFEDHADVPDSVRGARRRFGFDFGVIDYVLVDGEAVLLDMNKTPFVPDYRPMPRRQLADGLYSFLG